VVVLEHVRRAGRVFAEPGAEDEVARKRERERAVVIETLN
jgi:hypothetical protein